MSSDSGLVVGDIVNARFFIVGGPTKDGSRREKPPARRIAAGTKPPATGILAKMVEDTAKRTGKTAAKGNSSDNWRFPFDNSVVPPIFLSSKIYIVW
mmetsp:Transcript_14336/g.33374  ORF Transcript_14336/g.33374 Transcript_14336/m.33374 type:complete len:97 (-) Transcript_14336:227-517(-)